MKPIIKEALPLIKREIRISQFWKKEDEIEKLKGKLQDIFYFTAGELDLDPVIDKTEKIVSEIMALAKKRHQLLIKEDA